MSSLEELNSKVEELKREYVELAKQNRLGIEDNATLYKIIFQQNKNFDIKKQLTDIGEGIKVRELSQDFSFGVSIGPKKEKSSLEGFADRFGLNEP